MRDTAGALALAALTVSAAAIAFAVVAGWWSHSPLYFLLSTLLAVTASAVLGALCGTAAIFARWAPALWVAAASLLALRSWEWTLGGVPATLATALVPAAAAALGLVAARRLPPPVSARSPVAAVAVAAAYYSSRQLLPPLSRRLGLDGWIGEIAWPGAVLVAGVVVASFVAGVAGRGRPRVGAAVLVAVTVALAAGSALARRPPPQSLPPAAAGIAAAGAPNVLLVVLDTVRADHLSLYGYRRPTTPRLAARVARHPGAAVFPRAYSNGNWTVPSHASLLTGQLPSVHGAHFGSGSRPAGGESFAVAPGLPTVAGRLRAAGYRTVGVVANPWLIWTRGLRRGFELFVHPPPNRGLTDLGEPLRRLLVPGLFPEALDGYPGAQRVSRRLLEALAGCRTTAAPERPPCLALVNLLEPHALYTPRSSCRGRFAPWRLDEPIIQPRVDLPADRLARLETRYDEEICALDEALDGLLETLDERGLLAASWVFVTSDHGEAFGEHGVTEHSTSVYDEEVRVPLVVLPPAGRRLEASAAPVSLVDVAVTAAAIGGGDLYAGAPGPGRDLRRPPAAEPPAEPAARIEFYGDPGKARFFGALAAEPARAVVAGRFKLIEHAGRRELYDLDRDPGERLDLGATHPDVVAALVSLLPPLAGGDHGEVESPPLTPDQRDALRALGYL